VAAARAGLYVVRDGSRSPHSGANGAAWNTAWPKQVTWTSPALPWPHFLLRPVGLGGTPASPVTWWSSPRAAPGRDPGCAPTRNSSRSTCEGVPADPAADNSPGHRGNAAAGGISRRRPGVQVHMDVSRDPWGGRAQFQQRHPVLPSRRGLVEFNDDQAGNLAALISYYAFAALFPLLLVGLTVLNIVLKNNPKRQQPWRIAVSSTGDRPADQGNLGTNPGHRAAALPSAPSCCCSAPGAWRAPCECACGAGASKKEDRRIPHVPGVGLRAAAHRRLVHRDDIPLRVAGGVGHVINGGRSVATVLISWS